MSKPVITIDELEQLVDSHGYAMLLEMLSDIAVAKADHLQSNWQDSAGAKHYLALASRLNEACFYTCHYIDA